jgi:putative methylase
VKSKILREISKVEAFEEPKISLEQYMTPPELAADILHNAYMQGDIEGKKVVDLGTGTGIFAIGAALLGADVTAYEKDPDALELARENAEKLNVSEFIEFVEADIDEIDEEFDTALMNPPFSVHSEEGMKFLGKALDCAENVYSVVYGGRKSAIKDFVANSSHELRTWQEYEISLPATYGFHTEESHDAEVGVLITSKKD